MTVPLFNRDMVVEAYLFRYRRGNDLFSSAQATGIFDGASRSELLDLLNGIGAEAFSLGKPVFIPISYIMLLGDLAGQSKKHLDKVIFLLEEPPKPEEPYLFRLRALREQGLRFAVGGLYEPAGYGPILALCDYCFLSWQEDHQNAARKIYRYIVENFPNLIPVATGVFSREMLEGLRTLKYGLFETRFFRVAVSRGAHDASPLRMNSIRLINVVQDENFEFEEVSKIVQTDPVLTVSLLRLVNTQHRSRSSQIKTIQHAVAMLGQGEVRKWVATAVTQMLGSERPSEITRISLMRARFAENLSPLFEMAQLSQGIFLMGLFSVLDLILEAPMEEALDMVVVPDNVSKALLERKGMFFPILELIEEYENANWSEVSRRMIVHDIKEDDLANAYIKTLTWYRDLVMEAESAENS